MGRAYEVRKASIQKTGAIKAKTYSTFAKEIYLAAKKGLPDPDANVVLKRVIEKAKNGKLRGWSFGFEALKEREEPLEDGLKRRFVDEMNLAEVSIIDEHKIPCYVGTSIEMRAAGNSKIEFRGEDFKAKIIDETERKIDYSEYEQVLKQIGGK